MTMFRQPWLWALLCSMTLIGACSKPAEPPTEASAATPASEVAQPAAEPTEPAKPAVATSFVTVIYNPPKDPAAFEKYYWETHVPLVGEKQADIGFVAAELTKFTGTLDGKPSPYYRQAVLWFADAAARDKGLASAGFKAVGDDLGKFADGGLIGMVGELTSDFAPLLVGDTTSFVTVLYQQPKDAAAFETYYAATHVPLVGKHAQEIAFRRAELSQLSKNLDGTPPAFYRQAKLYFASEGERSSGLGTPGFKAVGDDLGNFATGGLVALVGHLTSAPTAAAATSP